MNLFNKKKQPSTESNPGEAVIKNIRAAQCDHEWHRVHTHAFESGSTATVLLYFVCDKCKHFRRERYTNEITS